MQIRTPLLSLILPVVMTFAAATPAQAALPKSRLPGSSFPGTYPGAFNPGPYPPPPPPLPPPPAPSPRISARTGSSVSLSWYSASTEVDGSRLERWQPGTSGGYATLATYTGPVGSQSYRDPGLSFDSLYCYRVTTWNSVGTTHSDPQCVYTRGWDAQQDYIGVWRAQLVLTTGTVSNADTEDAVMVALNAIPSMYVPNGNTTWVDYGRDDFERGDTFVYDLTLDKIGDYRDIEMVSVQKSGGDAWCVRDIALIVNEREVIRQSFASLPDGCRWTDIYTIDHDTLRASRNWQNFVSTGPGLTIERASFESRIEAILGDLAHDNQLYWGDKAGAAWVEATYAGPDRLHVDADMMADATGSNPDIDLDFDLVFDLTCNPEDETVTVSMTTENMTVEASGWLFELGEFFYCTGQWDWNCIDEMLDDYVTNSLPPLTFSSTFDSSLCPMMEVTESGNLQFSL